LIRIKFGTDGWRSIIAEDFTFDNVRAVAQAVACHIKSKGQDKKGIVIGYDNRFLSEHFARAVAEVMAGNSISVYIPRRATPTPVIAFAIKHFDTCGAVMLTASHNPPEYNGIKYIPEFAGPALPEETQKIEEILNGILETKKIHRISEEKAKSSGLWNEIDPLPAYSRHVQSLVNASLIKEAGLKIAVDPLYGAGMGYLEEILGGLGCQVVSIHNYRDPLFGGSMPDPREKNLSQLRERVLNAGAHLGLALDGDADRFGVIDRTGRFFIPNEILFLLLVHMVRTRKFSGASVARTVATTHMLDRVALRYGMDVKETPVGFKYIGQCLLRDGSILGGEESGGMSIKGHVPEKDGILGSVLVVEMVAANGKTLVEMHKGLCDEFGKMVSRRVDLPVVPEDKKKVLERLQSYNPTRIAGQRVVRRMTIDGTKLVNSDGSWVLIRPSGTEPLFRVYVEANSEEQLQEIQNQVRGELKI